MYQRWAQWLQKIMDDKYYPIRLEKAVPYLNRVISDLRITQGQPGYAYTRESVIHKYLKLEQDSKGKLIESHRLDSLESYIKFLDGGRNIFDFSGQLLEMLQIVSSPEVGPFES